MKQTTTFFVLFSLIFSLQAQDPNIILIIADDMGWNQVSSTTTTFVNGTAHPSDFYETPALDQLASEGISFPNGYVNGANCAPTRAAILSGQYAARPHNNVFTVTDLNRGNTASNSNLIGPDMGLASNGNIDEIPASAITIAETMQTAGYTTAHFGKYHMGEHESVNVSNNAPTDQGFDFNYGGGTDGGPGNYFSNGSTFGSRIGPQLDPYADVYTEAESIALSNDHANHPLTGTNKHVTDAMVEAAFDFIGNNSSSPFFMHFSNFAIHGPFNPSDARPDFRAKYNAKAISNPGSMNHDSNPGSAALAEHMDQAIGRLVDYLKTTPDPRNGNKPLSENTLVYFIADNGDAIKRSAAKQGQTPLKGMKGEYYEGGIRSITFAWTEPADPIGNPTYTPMLTNMGTINHTPVIAFDLYPTFVEAAGGTLPGGGYDIDGVSQWQMLTNGTAMTRESLFWHHPGYLIDSKRDSRPVTVIRKGDYKLMHFYEDAHYELYNLVNDLNEHNNLLPSGDQAIIDIANDMIDDMIDHLTDTSAPLPTYRDGGATVPMPTYVSASGSNSTSGCQPEAGYEAFWDFDSVSDANDASGNGHDPNPINGTLTYDSSDFMEGDQSVVFDGTVDINYSDATFISPATSARSISVWIKPTVLSGNQNIFEEGGNGNGLALRLNGSNLESIVRASTGGTNTISAAFPNDGGWHHVALVYDGGSSTQTLYIDGVVANSGSAPASLPSHNVTGGGIGGVIGDWDSFNESASNSYFNGKMDAFTVYNSVLTLTQVQNSACYSANSTAGCQAANGFEAYWDFDTPSNADDVSGNNHNPISVAGSLSYDDVDFQEGDRSVVFNGSTEIEYDDGTFLNTGTNTRSVAVWIKPTALVGTQEIFEEGGSGNGLALRLNGSNLEALITNNTDPDASVSTSYPLDGNWHHVALVFDGGSTRLALYIDGVLANENTSAHNTLNNHNSPGGVGGVIGSGDAFGSAAGDSFFDGRMDAMGVYDTALTLTQIQNAACISLSNDNFEKEIGKVYPNPFNDSLNISLKNYSEVTIELFDVLGKVTFSNRYLNTNSIEIPTNDLAQGLYLLRIKSNNGEVIKKVVKE
jgi:arylsulfatase A-like enzyme